VRHYTVGADGVERLEAIPLFAGLSVAELRMVARLVDGVEADAGETIVEQSTHSYQFVIIEEGEAEVLRDGVRVALLGPGEFFGELAILAGGSVRTASVIARTPMRALAFSAHYLHQIREGIPQVRERIDREALERLARNASVVASDEL
jgi:CRP/FNR family transcriptional regulator, cyclic AMP receptor protein